MKKVRTYGILHRFTAAVMGLCILLSMLGSSGLLAMPAYAADPTADIVDGSRVADPDTMDDYLNRLLTEASGSRYAGRVWTDKTVFAYGDGARAAGSHFDGTNTITLNMATDGYTGNVSFNSDFAHVFSALASSQVVNEYPPSPVDLVIVFDMSGSMGQDTRFGIDTGSNTYVTHDPTGDDTETWPSAGVPMSERIENSRVQQTLNAINETIDKLMEQNPQNRVAVCGYGANAVVLMPLGHYKRVSDETPYLSVGGMETLYHPSDLVYRTTTDGLDSKGLGTVDEDGWYWMNNRDTCYTVVVNAKTNNYTGILDEDGDAPDEVTDATDDDRWHPIEKVVSNNALDSDGNPVKAFPGAWENDGKVANDTPKDTFKNASVNVYTNASTKTSGWIHGDDGNDLIREIASTQSMSADDYVGYFTNTQGGIYLAYKQLADSAATTYTEPLSNGTISTVARIPAAIIMSDGGANFSFNEMGQNNETTYLAEDWYVRYGQKKSAESGGHSPTESPEEADSWYVNDNNWGNASTSYTLGKTDGHNKDYAHRLGADGEHPTGNLGDEWYNVYLPGEDTLGEGWEGLHGIYNTGADYYQDGTLSTPPGWQHAGVLYSSDNYTPATSGTIMEVLLTAAYMNDVVREHYQNGWTVNDATLDSQIPLSTYTMNVDTEHVPQWGRMRLYPTLDPSGHPLDQLNDTTIEKKWYENTTKFGTDKELWDALHLPEGGYGRVSLSAIYGNLAGWWEEWKSGNNPEAAMGNNWGDPHITINSIPGETEITYTNGNKEEIKVSRNDILDNIAYNNGFYDVTSGALDTTFEEILGLILGNVFVPVSGDNDAGVGDSVTYQDPIGEYMEIKNGAINATPYHTDNSLADPQPTDYDMALLLFGEMHGLTRAGVYDFQWNDAWIVGHNPSGQGTAAMVEGWYLGDDPADAKSGGSGEIPDADGDGKGDYDTATAARAAGWVYRLNFRTVQDYVPILGETLEPKDLPDQVKNTVYTVYRFNCDATDRDKLRRNPIYGEVPDKAQEIWDALGGDYPNNTYDVPGLEAATYPGLYRLNDIRVWVEDTGDFVDEDGRITPNTGYDRSLYVNIPAAAIPTELATITLGKDGVLSYETNLGKDHPAGSQITVEEDGKTVTKLVTEDDYKNFCYQSTPFRLFYAVGLEDDLILWNEDRTQQTGVDFNAISPEYLQSHTDLENHVWFISNYYSGTRYSGYATDDVSRTRGDPTVTFSPGADNRYYVFQKPLPLYAHAYRANGSDLTPVDGSGFGPNKEGNGDTTWEDDNTGGTGWGGGQYMGTYENANRFKDAVNGMEPPGSDGKQYITDGSGIKYEYVTDGIVFLQEDLLEHVTSKSDAEGGGYAEGSISFSSDDYYFILLEFYVPYPGTTGKDNENNTVYGTQAGHMVQYALARKGSEFGSGFASENINNGDMLCWTDVQNHLNVEFAYLSKTDTGDLTRGEPTFEKLTYKDGGPGDTNLRTYLQNTCGIKDTKVLDEQVAYWTKMQEDPQVIAALAAAAQQAGKDV